MTQLSVGIIGCGNISTTYLKFARLFKALKLVAVADINIEVAQVRADSITDLLSAPDVDVIVNLTIPLVHYDVTRQILEAGKHAYSEKPLVLTLDEGMHLRNLASSKNLRVGSAPNTFLGGAHQLARAAIDGDKIGQIIGGTCHVMGRGMEVWHPNPDFFPAWCRACFGYWAILCDQPDPTAWACKIGSIAGNYNIPKPYDWQW